SSCTYTIDVNNRVQVNWMEGGDSETETLTLSDDFSYLTLARRVSEANEGIEGVLLGMREVSSVKGNSDLDGQFGFAQISKSYTASGTGHPQGQTDDQQATSFLRGRFEFDSSQARQGPNGEAGYAACSYEVRAEQSTIATTGSPGGIVLRRFGTSQADRSTDDCVYNVDAMGGVSIAVTETDQEIQFIGHLSDDSNVFALVANSNTDINDPQFPGLSLDAVFHSAVAVRYNGNWDLDADGDGVTNFQELIFPNDNGEDVFVLTALDDFSGNGAPEVAAVQTLTDLTIQVAVADGDSGSSLGNINFLSNAWRNTHLIGVPGLANGGRTAVGVVAENRSTDLPIIQLKDPQGGALVGNLFPWSAAWQVLDTKVVNGLAPGGAPAVATLALRRSDGLQGVELRDPANGTLIRLIYPLGFGWTPSQMQFLDVAGATAVAVLNTRDTDGLAIVQVRNAENTNLVRNVFPLGLGWSPIELKTIPDISGNNVDEVAVRMTRDIDGLEIIQIRDASTNALVINVYPIGAGAGGWTTREFNVVDDNGTARLAILSVRDSDGQMLLQTRNLNTGAVVRNTFFIAPPNLYQNATVVIDDFNGSNASEYGILTRNANTGTRFVQIRDIASSVVIRNVFQP
ncbi:MAG: hypothetical protein AAF438_15500, partial [Pseudomonadota bacterium]